MKRTDMIQRELNLSQNEIAKSEMAAGGSAVNTISEKLIFAHLTPQAVQAAVRRVLAAADLSRARVDTSALPWRMVYEDSPLVDCRVLEARSLTQAEEYMTLRDGLPYALDGALFEAEILPVTEGGCVLYLRFHHVAIDGYGISRFTQRILDALAGRDVACSDYAESAAFAAEEVDEAYLSACFADADFAPAIFAEEPADMDREVRSYTPGREFCAALSAYAEAEGVTKAYVLGAALAFYLARASGKPDAVFIMPRMNREREQREVLGCFTMATPVRVRVPAQGSFAQLCREVARVSREAAAHKRQSLSDTIAFLRRLLDREQVSEYTFDYCRCFYDTDIDVRVEHSVAGAMRNHLTFTVFEDAQGELQFRFDCRQGVYTATRADDFYAAVCGILSRGMAGTDLSDIPALGEAERERSLSHCGVSYPLDPVDTIPSLLAKAAARYPDRPALYADGGELTFAELDRVSDRIAMALVDLGVRPGDRVAFMLGRDYRLVPTILGISKAGACFIPVDPAYPEERVNYIIENSSAAYLISSAEVENAARYGYIEVDGLLCFDRRVPLPAVGQDDLAYIIYTSGTTGRPKGVMLPHKGIANIVCGQNNPFNRDICTNCRGIVAIGSVCFDISLFEIFVPLFNGLFVVFGNEKAMVDAAELAGCIRRYGADVLHCTPSRIAAYLSNPAFSEALEGVKAVLAAGEVLPRSLVERLRDSYGIRIYNGYGPTETTIGATITEAGDMESIGLPIGNMGILLLGPDRRMVPWGAEGEICVWGVGVGMGYWNRPEETAERYVEAYGRRMYRTGDLGRLLADGRLRYIGRNDRQVKLRGLRIELGEIERSMEELPGIGQAVCMVRRSESAEHLVGFYTVSEGRQVEEQALREHLRGRVTSYMVPEIFLRLEAMPLTPGGKTDLRALAELPVQSDRPVRRPQSEREHRMCGIFARVLEQPEVMLNDNFFLLGGDSLSVASLLAEVEVEFALENSLQFGDLYKYPTPEELLAMLTHGEEESTGYDLESLDYSGFEDYLQARREPCPEPRRLGTVLLTGATGYLGIHVLLELLRRRDEVDRVICLVRKKAKLSPEKRLKSAMFYYDMDDHGEELGTRWCVTEGDITDGKIFAGDLEERIDTVINCAANVAHFAYGDTLERTNTDGVRNLIAFARRCGAVLCHISTISVAGVTLPEREDAVFDEHSFYIGQYIHNRYIYSKYVAEHELLRAAVDDGLHVKIMRVGNLQGRASDGEFQMNLQSNAFARQLSAFVKMGAVPEGVWNARVNFSPVDETARMIVSLSGTGQSTTVFNVTPRKEVAFADIFSAVERVGRPVSVLSADAFAALLRELKASEQGKERVEGLATAESDGRFRQVPVRQSYTDACLSALGESWQELPDSYLEQYISALDGLGLFEDLNF